MLILKENVINHIRKKFVENLSVFDFNTRYGNLYGKYYTMFDIHEKKTLIINKLFTTTVD